MISSDLSLRLIFGQSQPQAEATADSRGRLLTLNECQKVGVDRLSVRGCHSVGKVLVGLERPVLQQLRRQRPRVRVRNDLIILAVHHLVMA
jgi:hypothetical protein